MIILLLGDLKLSSLKTLFKLSDVEACEIEKKVEIIREKHGEFIFKCPMCKDIIFIKSTGIQFISTRLNLGTRDIATGQKEVSTEGNLWTQDIEDCCKMAIYLLKL